MDDSESVNNVSPSKRNHCQCHTRQLKNLSKRIKYDETVEGDEENLSFDMHDTSDALISNTNLKRKSPIMFMPTEILEKIFRYIPHTDLGLI